MFLASIVLPGRARASLNPPHYSDAALNVLVQTEFSDVPERAEERAATSAWTLQALDEATGFTETAAAIDPNPIEHHDSAAESKEAAGPTQDEPPIRAKVPEPPTLLLFGTVLIGVARGFRKKIRP